MRIVEILKSCSNPIMGAGLFYSGPKWLQNVQADNVVLPCVFMDQPIDFKFIRDFIIVVITECKPVKAVGADDAFITQITGAKKVIDFFAAAR